jgi:hypothetical protein
MYMSAAESYNPDGTKNRLPTRQEQRDADAIYIMELEMAGFRAAAILETRTRLAGINWRHGDLEEYLETHWQSFEPGFASEEDEKMQEETLRRLEEYRATYGSINVRCANPTEDMALLAGYLPDYPHGLVLVMVHETETPVQSHPL